MDMDLVDKQLGAEGELDLKLSGGDLLLSVTHASSGAEASLSVKVKGDYFMDKLKAAIPGTIDDAIIDIIKAALKG